LLFSDRLNQWFATLRASDSSGHVCLLSGCPVLLFCHHRYWFLVNICTRRSQSDCRCMLRFVDTWRLDWESYWWWFRALKWPSFKLQSWSTIISSRQDMPPFFWSSISPCAIRIWPPIFAWPPRMWPKNLSAFNSSW
jgi:hypothetical protein